MKFKTMNKQDNVPQVKTVEEEAEALLTVMASVPMPATIKPETSANLLTLFRGFKSRIEELEADLDHCCGVANGLREERDKYREALEIAVKEIKYQYRQKGKLGGEILSRIEQSLNSKEVGGE